MSLSGGLFLLAPALATAAAASLRLAGVAVPQAVVDVAAPQAAELWPGAPDGQGRAVKPPVELHRKVVLDEAPQNDARLQQLRAALQANDGDAVLRITDDLRRPYAALGHEELKKSAISAPDDALAHPALSAAAPGAERTTQTCPFDDVIFGLTPRAKLELSDQLKQPGMQEALRWVQSGGWWSCAGYEGECKCSGEVRFVLSSRKQLGSSVDAAAHDGRVKCRPSVFGAASLVGAEKPDSLYCECKSKSREGSTAGGFHLEKRLTSTSVLQDGWVMLLRLLGKTHLLPLGTGDRTYGGMQNWAARTPKELHENLNVVLERFWIEKYMREIALPNIRGPRCLEWGDPLKKGHGFHYANMVPGCSQKYDMQFDYVYWQHFGKRVDGNIVYSDILSLPQVLEKAYVQMDAIFATQVFEHLADPLAAAQALYKATAPGGVVVYTGPQQAQFHLVPHDYYRYTVEGVKYAFVRAGFCVPNDKFAGGGDFVMDIGRDAGLQIQDFPMEEMEEAYQVGYDKVSHSAIGIHALAFKPPHASCSDPTAGWAELARLGIRA